MISYLISSLKYLADTNKDGVITRSEYQQYLRNQNLSQTIATSIFNLYDNGDNSLTDAELLLAFNSYDADGNNQLSFSENLSMQNDLSKITIDTTIDEDLFNNLMKGTNSFFNLINADTLDGGVTLGEVQNFLNAQNYSIDGSQEFLNFYDQNKDGVIDIIEVQSKSIELDLDKNGSIDQVEGYPIDKYLRPFTNLELNSNNFIKYIDGAYFTDEDGNPINKTAPDGMVNQTEYQVYLQSQGLPSNMAAQAFTRFDTNKDGNLNFIEMYNAYKGFDADGNNNLDLSESLNMQNQLSGLNINTNVTSTQYSYLSSAARSFINSLDTNRDGRVTAEEYSPILENSNYHGESAEAFLNYFDTNGDGVDILEYLQRTVALDADGNGRLSSTEFQPASSLLDKYTGIELYAKNIIKALDKDTDPSKDVDTRNKLLDLQEYMDYMTDTNGMPAYMAKGLLEQYGSGTSISYDQLVAAYNSFDANGDGSMSFEEGMNFQNSMSRIDFEPTMDAKVYMKLFSAAQSVIKTMDSNKDGNLDVTEVRAYIDLANQKMTVSENIIPDGYAENLLRVFDRDNNPEGTPVGEGEAELNKDGVIDIFEYMKGLMDFDINEDGTINTAESLQLKDQLYNVRLFDEVDEFFEVNDYNEDRNLSKDELNKYLISQGLPTYLTDQLFELYDLGLEDTGEEEEGVPVKDGLISRLELMQVFKEFDVNENNILDIDEKLNFYSKLAEETVDLEIDTARSRQYSGLFESLQEYVVEIDNNDDGILSSAELQKYFKDQNLPIYLADNTITTYDKNADTSIDLIELMKANIDYDKDQSGKLEFNEQLALNVALSNVGITPASTLDNEKQYQSLYNDLKDYLVKNDKNQDKLLDATELAAYFKTQNLPEYMATNIISKYNVNGADSLDLIELMKAQIDYDTDKSGKLEFNEQLASNLNIANLSIDPASVKSNEKQYQTIYNDLKDYLSKNDLNTDQLLDATELAGFFKTQNLPEALAEDIISKYNVNGTDSLDILEIMQSIVSYDINKTGKLELNESLELASYLAETDIDPDADLASSKANLNQYTTLSNDIATVFKSFDVDGNKILDETELTKYFYSRNLSKDYIDSFITEYDTVNGAGIDLLELMKANIEFDANNSGKIEFYEKLIQESDLTGVEFRDTPNAENEVEYQRLYNTVKGFFDKYDPSEDNTLNETELIAFFKDKNLPASVANTLIESYGSLADGNINILQFLDAYIDYDVDVNGYLQFAERLALDVSNTNVDITSTAETERQYEALFKTVDANVKKYDKRTSNNQLDQAELEDYFRATGFSPDLASKAIEIYDTNGDKSLDSIELLRAYIDYDANQSGVIEQNELLAQNAVFSEIDGISSDIAYANQNIGNFKYASSVIKSYDKDKSGTLSDTELNEYFKSLNLPEYMAEEFRTLYDYNKDGSLNNLEIMKGFIDADINKSGKLDFDEKTNLYSKLAGEDMNYYEDFSVNNDNNAQISLLWNFATSVLKYDINKDKEFTAEEIGAWFKTQYVPQYMADRFVQQNANENGLIDVLTLTRALAELDANQNGKIDTQEYFQMYSNTSDANITTNESNYNQTYSFWKTIRSIIAGYDGADQDKLLSASQLDDWLKTLGVPQYVADGLIKSGADANGDGSFDLVEITSLFRNIDQSGNNNGALDFDDYMALFERGSGIDIPQITDSNRARLSYFWTMAKNITSKYDGSKNRDLSAAEVGAWLATLGMPQYMADNFVADFNLNNNSSNNSIDSMELFSALLTIDENQNSKLDTGDIISLIDRESRINFTDGYANSVQLTGIYNKAVSMLKYDATGDKVLVNWEFQAYAKALGITLTTAQADAIIGSGGSIDIAQMMRTFISFDANNDGGLDSTEWANFISTYTPAA